MWALFGNYRVSRSRISLNMEEGTSMGKYWHDEPQLIIRLIDYTHDIYKYTV